MQWSEDGAGRAGALLWLGCFQFFVAEQVVRAHVRGAYSMARNHISDLGARQCFDLGAGCAPLHWVMNASFVLQGLLIVFGSVLVGKLLPSAALVRASRLCFVLAGAGVLVVGLDPEDGVARVHFAGAAVHFLAGAVAMLLMGMALRAQARRSTVAGTLSVAAGAVTLVATVLLGA
ncbi:MAG TPA: DUF998 domain-containing protein, partial [Acidobacteriaceae bacterium]